MFRHDRPGADLHVHDGAHVFQDMWAHVRPSDQRGAFDEVLEGVESVLLACLGGRDLDGPYVFDDVRGDLGSPSGVQEFLSNVRPHVHPRNHANPYLHWYILGPRKDDLRREVARGYWPLEI